MSDSVQDLMSSLPDDKIGKKTLFFHKIVKFSKIIGICNYIVIVFLQI